MDELSSFYFYIFAFGGTVLLALAQERFFLRKQRDSNILTFFIVMIPSLLSGLRYLVGTDYWTYTRWYNTYKNLTFPVYIERFNFEVGYYFICQIGRVFDSVYLMFFIMALLTVNFVYEGLRYYRKNISLPLAMMVYLFTFFPNAFNVVRQYLAVSIIFYAYQFVFEKNFKAYFGWGIVAMSFHLSAVIALPFYFVHQKYAYLTVKLPSGISETVKKLSLPEKIKEKAVFPEKIKLNYMKAFLYFFMALFFCFFSQIMTILTDIEFFAKYTKYITGGTAGGNRELYLTALTLAGVLAFRRELKKLDQRNEFFISLLIVGFMLGFLGFIDADIKRISLYFDVVRVLLLGALVKVFPQKEWKTFLTSGVVIYSLFFFLLMFYVLGHSEIFPYQSILGEGMPLDISTYKEFGEDFWENFWEER